MKIELDDEQIREKAVRTDGINVAGLKLRQVTASDISIFEMCGISKDIHFNGQPVNLGDHYKVHAAAYVLSNDPKRVSREVFDVQSFVGIVHDWVREKGITSQDFVQLAEAILELNSMWYKSSSDTGKDSPGN